MIERPATNCHYCSDPIAKGEPRFTQMISFRMQYDPIVIPGLYGSVSYVANNVFANVPNGLSAHKGCVEVRANQPFEPIPETNSVLHKNMERDGDELPGQLKITDE